MSKYHAASGEVFSLGDDPAIHEATPRLLLKTPMLKVVRLVLDQGKEIATHSAPGEITVHCLEGRVAFECHGTTKELRPGDLLYLAASEPHALFAHEPSALLVTMVLPGTNAQST